MFEQITDLGTNLGDLRSIRLTHLPTQACLGGFWVHNNGNGKRISAGCSRFCAGGKWDEYILTRCTTAYTVCEDGLKRYAAPSKKHQQAICTVVLHSSYLIYSSSTSGCILHRAVPRDLSGWLIIDTIAGNTLVHPKVYMPGSSIVVRQIC